MEYKKKHTISREDAARYLGVSLQTVTNWADKGMLSGRMTRGQLWLSRESLEACKEAYQSLGWTEDRVRALQAELDGTRKELEDRVTEAREALRIFKHTSLGGGISAEAVGALLGQFSCVLNPYEEDTVRELFFSKNTVAELAARRGVTMPTVLHTAHRAVRKVAKARPYGQLVDDLYHARARIDELERTAAQLATENKLLAAAAETLAESRRDAAEKTEGLGVAENAGSHMAKLFKTNIVDWEELSVRTLNCLKSDDILTVGDLVTRTPNELMRCRNFGKKCMVEVERAVASRGLQLGVSEDWVRRVAETYGGAR